MVFREGLGKWTKVLTAGERATRRIAGYTDVNFDIE